MNAPVHLFNNHAKCCEELLGCFLLSPATIDSASSLTGDDFAIPEHGATFDLFQNMRTTGSPINANTVGQALHGHRGAVCITDLVQWGTSAVVANAESLIAVVREYSNRRRMREIIQGALTDIDAGSFADNVRDAIQAEFERLSTGMTDDMLSMSDVAKQVQLEIRAGKSQNSIRFGISDIDDRFGQSHGGELVVIAARPSEGKTALGMQIAQNVANEGKTVLFASLEMQSKELFVRSLVQSGQMDHRKARNQNFDNDDADKIAHHEKDLTGRKLFVWAPSSANFPRIAAMARICKAKHGIGLLVVDYLQLIKSTNPRDDNRVRVMEASRGLKQLAKELDCPVIALAQLNREADRDQPRLSHLAESAAIEQDADAVMFLHKDGDGNRQLLIMKNRHGAAGKIDLVFEQTRMLFRSKNTCLADDSTAELNAYQWPTTAN